MGFSEDGASNRRTVLAHIQRISKALLLCKVKHTLDVGSRPTMTGMDYDHNKWPTTKCKLPRWSVSLAEFLVYIY